LEGGGVELPTRQCAWVIAYLITRRHVACERETLARAVWPRVEREKALASLRNAMSAINREAGDRLVTGDEAMVRLSAEVESDWGELRRVLLLSRVEPDEGARVERLDAAGELLDQTFLPGCRQEWCRDIRAQMEAEAGEVAGARVELEEARGDWEAVVEAAEKWRTIAPGSSGACAAAMRAWSTHGRADRALEVFEACVTELKLLRLDVPEELATMADRLREGRADATPAIPALDVVLQRAWRENRASVAEFLASNWSLVLAHSSLEEGKALSAAAAEAAGEGSRSKAILLRIAGFSAMMAADYSAAERHMIAALQAADELGDRNLRAAAGTTAAFLYAEMRRWSESRAMLERTRGLAEDRGVELNFRITEACILWDEGSTDEAKAAHLECAAERLPPRLACSVDVNLAIFYAHDQNWREAQKWAARAVRGASAQGDPYLSAAARMTHCLALAGRGTAEEARTELRVALELAVRHRMTRLAAMILDHGGQALSLMGDEDRAYRALEAAERLRINIGHVRSEPEERQFGDLQRKLAQGRATGDRKPPLEVCTELAGELQ
jgi:DNA-binding SARP family transcriptional activator